MTRAILGLLALTLVACVGRTQADVCFNDKLGSLSYLETPPTEAMLKEIAEFCEGQYPPEAYRD